MNTETIAHEALALPEQRWVGLAAQRILEALIRLVKELLYGMHQPRCLVDDLA